MLDQINAERLVQRSRSRCARLFAVPTHLDLGAINPLPWRSV
jgi:hypothetical protein